MQAEIISIGTELLLGQIVDTNAPYLAQHLSQLGIDLYWISQVGDNPGRLHDLLRRAWGRADLVITTGGLGPTEDDTTREAIAALLGESMEVDSALEQQLRHRFSQLGITMPNSNIKQATLIPSAETLPNPFGTAPGWWVEREGKTIVAMPGVPFEMHRMWEQEALPRLHQRQGTATISSTTLKILGLGESTVEEKLGTLIASANPTAATYAKADGIHVRLTAKAQSSTQAKSMVTKVKKQVQAILGQHIYGEDNDTLEGVIGQMLQARQLTIATLEQVTAGLLASTITNVPDNERYFRGGLLATTPESLLALGLDQRASHKGAHISKDEFVSAATAAAMATMARQTLDTDIGLATVGVAAPSDVSGPPTGTLFYAVDYQGRVTTGGRNWTSTIPEVKHMAVLGTLNLLRLALLSER